MTGGKTREVIRNEAYFFVRYNDECRAQRSKWLFLGSLLKVYYGTTVVTNLSNPCT